MNKSKAISRLKEQITQVPNIHRSEDSFTKWRRDTEVLLSHIFKENSRQVKEFSNVRYSPMAYTTDNYEAQATRAFLAGMARAKALLESMLSEIEEFWEHEKEEQTSALETSPLYIIENIFRRFHVVARQLRDRHGNRATLDVTDEYDIQDLLHALLLLHFDDIRAEDWTPNYAGNNSRVDFLLKDHSIIIEVKRASRNLSAKQIADQLIIDKTRYENHPDAKILICFVYDPEGVIANYSALENDLSKPQGTLETKVVVAPKGL
jgi:REase_DpnII-MboI